MSGKIACYIAAIALILMLGAVIFNAFYVKNTTDIILSLIDPANYLDDPRTNIAAIGEYWDQHIQKLSLSLSQKDLEEISLIIDDLKLCASVGDDEEYKRSMARLKRAIEEIKKREEFSFENIF